MVLSLELKKNEFFKDLQISDKNLADISECASLNFLVRISSNFFSFSLDSK